MKKKKIAVILLAVIISALFVGCSFELSDSDVDYLSMFETEVQNISFGLNPIDIEEYLMPMETYVDNNDSQTFYVDEADGYTAKSYKYIIVTMQNTCELDEVAMYIKWDKESSGSNGNRLDVQLFKFSGEDFLTPDKIRQNLIAIAKGTAGPTELYKTENDTSLPLIDGKWNNGKLIKIRNFAMAKGDKFVIKFVQNCDFEYVYDAELDGEESEKYTFTELEENNVCFKLDKLMFHIM